MSKPYSAKSEKNYFKFSYAEILYPVRLALTQYFCDKYRKTTGLNYYTVSYRRNIYVLLYLV